MLDAELRESARPTTFDNTMRVMFASCPRRMYWFMRGYDYAARPTFFTFGSAAHAGLGRWHSLQSSPRFSEPEGPAYAAARSLSEALTLYDTEAVEFDAPPSDVNSRLRLIQLLEKYFTTYPSEPWRVIGAEQGFVFPILGTDYFYAGSIDGYIEWPGYGVLALEHKTTSAYLSDAFINSWKFSTQVTGYLWYLHQIIDPDSIYGCLMNLITKQLPGPRSNWSTPWATRSIQGRSNTEINSFREDLLWTIELFNNCWNNWVWPKTVNPIECVGGIGKSACLFRNICLQSADLDYRELNPAQFAGIKLRDKPWAPWEREGND